MSRFPLALAQLAAAAALLVASRSPLEAQEPLDAGEVEEEASSQRPIVWTELGPAGLVARAVTTEKNCPDIKINGRRKAMQVRAEPSPPDFPVLVCEYAVPDWAGSASIEGRRVPLLYRRPEWIAVIGDAGCRIRGSVAQACNDPAQWPFARIANRAARARPDLVIHTGDYIYREDPCPAGNSGCEGSPHGDNWATLQADFFTPAGPLLESAPWVFLRGNHEDCARGGNAWFRFFDPRPIPSRCLDYTEPYTISLGRLDLAVLDSSFANDFEISPDQVAIYKTQFDSLRPKITGDTWLLTHKPLYVIGHLGTENGVEKLFFAQQVLQAASANSFPAGFRLFIGGHVHVFETLSFGAGRPPQMTVGNSGTALDAPIVTPLPGLEIAGRQVSSGVAVDRFGFVTMEHRYKGKWNAVLRGVRGERLLECVLGAESLDCDRPDH